MDRIREILALLDNPGQLTNGQIAELHAELLDLFDQVRDGAIELPEDTNVLAECRNIAEAANNLAALAHERIAAEEQEQAELDALAATLHPEPVPEPDEVPTPDDVEPEPETAPEPVAETEPEPEPAPDPEAEPETATEPVAAAAPARLPLGHAATRQPVRSRPRPEQTRREPTTVITAANGGQIEASAISQTMARGFRELGPNAGKRTLVTISGQYDDAHRLDETDEAGNGRKLDAIAASAQEPGAFDQLPVTAAGLGWCTPSQVLYDENVQALANRPATAALPTVGIDRGGVRIPVSPTLSDINFVQDLADATPDDTAVTVFTEQNDIDVDPNDDATLKPIQKIACPTWVEFRTYAIVKRLRFDNFAARTNPEHVASFNDLAAAAFARVAETKVLDLIKDDPGTTNVAESTTLLGSSRDFIEMVLRLVEFMRNAERATDGAGGGPTIRLMAPSWSVGLNQADLVRTFRDFDTPTTNLVVPRTDLVQMLRDAGVNPTFYIDSPSTGPTQLLGKQVDGQAPRHWPCDIQYGLWFEGHFAHGDEGELNLGVVRDSTLNAQNDYETFVESFETVIARRGPEALWVTQKLVADGAYAASVDISGDVDCS